MLFRPLIACLMLVLMMAVETSADEKYQLVDWQTQQVSTSFLAEGATAGDFNNDGKTDLAYGTLWYEGPDFKNVNPIRATKPFDPHGYSDSFFLYADDVNNDGWEDIVEIGFPGKAAYWYENPQKPGLWTRWLIGEVVDNESPTYADLNQDGQKEIVCSAGGNFGYYAPEKDSPESPWKWTTIAEKSTGGRFTHGLGLGDVNSDGRTDLLERNGWWEQPETAEQPWSHHKFNFAPGGSSQMFAYDIDADGDADVVTALAAHGHGVVWWEQTQPNQFQKHTIVGATADESPYGILFTQPHAIDFKDINGDGLPDIVTGKRYWAHGIHGDADPTNAPVLYWFELRQTKTASGIQAEFIPHLIDDSSGVGVDVLITDANNDNLPDVVVGNKLGVFVHTQSRRAVDQQRWLASQPQRLEDAAVKGDYEPNATVATTPESAAKQMTVPKGFSVENFAGEPMVHQPVAMTHDSKGRLWIAEAHTYPRRAPEGKGKDRIIILTDTDNDGKADERKVFAEGLNLVSGIEVGFGGVWVGAAPYFLFIPDQNHDDIPDSEPQILLDGWGYQDTHETLNTFIWGPDGWLYGCQGVFTHSKVGKPGSADKDRTPLNACVWRYHPIDHEFEVFAHGTSNPWGVTFNDHGDAFITACVIPHLYHIIPNGYYIRQAGRHFRPHLYDDLKTIADHAHYAGNLRDHAWWGGRNSAATHNDTDSAGGGHAHCGAMIYLGDNWPTSYRNSIFMANIHGNRINNNILERQGSGFVGHRGKDFLFANDPWFRGINLRTAPDGSVYIIDWYDKNACHRTNPDIWDRTNGRVYRVWFNECQPESVDLRGMSSVELAQLQMHENDWYVTMGRRLLQERFAAGEIDSQATKVLQDQLINTELTTPQRLRALWALHAMQQLSPQILEELLTATGTHNESLVSWAIRLRLQSETDKSWEQKLIQLAQTKPTSRVNLELCSALPHLSEESNLKLAEILSSQPDFNYDQNIPLMIWFGLEPLVEKHPERAMQIASKARVNVIREHTIRRLASFEQGLNLVIDHLNKQKDPKQVQQALSLVQKSLEGRRNLPMPKNWAPLFEQYRNSEHQQLKQQVLQLTVQFGDQSVLPLMEQIVQDASQSKSVRQLAFQALINGRPENLKTLLLSLVDDTQMQSDAIRELAGFDDAQIPEQLLEKYKRFNATIKTVALTTLASRKKWSHRMLKAIEAGTIPRQDLPAYVASSIAQYQDEPLTALLTKVWGAVKPSSAEKKVLMEKYQQQFTTKVLAEADLSHGRVLYEKTCASCHKLFGEGGAIGPDLTGSNRAKLEYLLENILDPSAVVGKDYQTVTVVTDSGRVMNGLVKSETEDILQLQTVNDLVTLEQESILERKVSDLSLMPEGQLNPMSPEQIRDLLAYLQTPSQVSLPGEGLSINPQTGRIPGAIEGESIDAAATGGNLKRQGMANFSNGKWSGNAQLWWTGAKPGHVLSLPFEVKQQGTYQVRAAFTKAHDYGQFVAKVNGKKVAELDLFYKPSVISTGTVDLGTHDLKAGKQMITLELTGAHPDATPRYMNGIDYIHVMKVEPK